MKRIIVATLTLIGCATVSPYAYDELNACPAQMSSEQHESGVVRCRAMCSSYARDFAEYTGDCKCWCAPPGGVKHQAPTYQSPTSHM